VPLGEAGFGLGLVARRDRRGIVLGYFAPVRFPRLPSLEAAAGAWSGQWVLVTLFGDLGLLDGTWSVVGKLPGWRRDEWPMPAFGHRDLLTGGYLRITYSEDGGQEVDRRPISVEEFETLPDDGLAGSGYVETLLAIRLEERLT
jgi:hypothetical protein